MKTSYDPEADAFYARFVPETKVIERTVEVAPGVMLDLDASGDLVGVEVLSVMRRIAGAYRRTPELAPALRASDAL